MSDNRNRLQRLFSKAYPVDSLDGKPISVVNELGTTYVIVVGIFLLIAMLVLSTVGRFVTDKVEAGETAAAAREERDQKRHQEIKTEIRRALARPVNASDMQPPVKPPIEDRP